jgi:hypothetical protein
VFGFIKPFPLLLIFQYRDMRITIGGVKDDWMNAIPDLPPQPSFSIEHPTVQKWLDSGLNLYIFIIKNQIFS